MDSLHESARLLRQSQTLSAEFVRIEIELAITFCKTALSTDDVEKTRRNLEHARRAYEVAGRFASQLKINGDSFQSRPDVCELTMLFAEVEELLRS